MGCIGQYDRIASKPKPGKERHSVPPLTMLNDTLRYGLFLSSLAGVYVTVDELLAALLGKKRYETGGGLRGWWWLRGCKCLADCHDVRSPPHAMHGLCF